MPAVIEYIKSNQTIKKTNKKNMKTYFIFSAGLVILSTPTQPVVEGSDVTLHCIHKETALKAKLKTELKHIRDFYKNGLHLMTCYTNNMTIQNVTKADEGLYKCSISSAGESPESWLSVYKPLTG